MYARRFLAVLAAGCLVGVLGAQSTGNAAPAPGAPRPERSALSGRIAAALREKLPAYTPPPAGSAEALETPSDVVVMPEMVVREKREIPLEEREWLTMGAFLESLRKRYPGASKPGQGVDESLHQNYAALMEFEERRLRKLKSLTGLADTIGAAAGEEKVASLRREIERAGMRRPDPITEAMDLRANNGRR